MNNSSSMQDLRALSMFAAVEIAKRNQFSMNTASIIRDAEAIMGWILGDSKPCASGAAGGGGAGSMTRVTVAGAGSFSC